MCLSMTITDKKAKTMQAKSFLSEKRGAVRHFHATVIRGEVSDSSVQGYLRVEYGAKFDSVNHQRSLSQASARSCMLLVETLRSQEGEPGCL